MGKEEFEAFHGQQELFGYSQAVAVGDTVYVAGTPAWTHRTLACCSS
jgi:hypothetical protein